MPKFRHRDTGEEINVDKIRITVNGSTDLTGKYPNLNEDYDAVVDERDFRHVAVKQNPKDKQRR